MAPGPGAAVFCGPSAIREPVNIQYREYLGGPGQPFGTDAEEYWGRRSNPDSGSHVRPGDSDPLYRCAMKP